MLASIPAAAFAVVLLQGAPPSDPRAIVREVTAAVESDRTASARASWQALNQREPANPAARLGLATLARLEYDYPTADSLYRRLFANAPADDRRFSAYARLGLAEGLYAEGRLGEIEGLLVQARSDARAAADRYAEGEAMFGLARVRALNQGAEIAIALLDSSLRVLPPDARLVRASDRCLRAHFRLVLGSHGATEELAEALAFSRQVAEPRAEAMCLRAIGLKHRFAGHYDSTLADLQRIEEIRRRTRDRSRLAEALFLQGEALLDLAAFGQALDAWHLALAEARASHNLYVGASVRLALAALYFRLNDNVTAAGYVNQAIQEYAAQADSGGLMMARSWSMQVKEAAGDFDGARRETQEAIGFFARQGDVAHEADLYQTLADIAMHERDWNAAEQALDTSAALLGAHSSTEADADMPNYRGRLALHRGDLVSAERNFQQYLRGLGSREGLWQYETRAYLAEIHARQGRLEQAEQELTLAADQLDAWRATLVDREMRTLAFQASTSEANDRNNSIAWVIALLASGGRATAAFELAERRRGRDLADRMQRVEALSRPTADSGSQPATPIPNRPRAADLAAAIPNDSIALLEYATGAFGSPTTVFALTRPHAGPVEVRAAVLEPADSLAVKIGRLTALFESGEDAPWLARSLGDAVLGPIVSQLGPQITQLVVVPDGPLHRLPFDALRLADGRLVIERFAISVAPSAVVMGDLWKRGSRLVQDGDSIRLLAFGDPAFPESVPPRDATPGARAAAETYQAAFATSGGLPRLRASGREVQRIARYVQSADVRLREGASAAYLKRIDPGRYRILHFATHAVVDEHAAGRTALVLAPGNGETGFVGPGELAGLHLNADLVVLSACRSAGGVVVDGEGVQGLSAPLLQAGARSLVATGWRISDRGTLKFVEAFYANMARGESVGQALRETKLQMIRDGLPAGEWAGFTLIGDPTIRIPLRQPWMNTLYWLPAAAVLLTAIAYRIRKQRKAIGGEG